MLPTPMAWRRAISSAPGVEAAKKQLRVDVVAGLAGEVELEHVAELAGVVGALPLLVHAGDDVGHPPGAVLGDRVLQAGVALEDAAEQQHPERPGRPPPGLGRVDRHEAPAQRVVGRAGARVGVEDQAGLLARRPHRLVRLVDVGGGVEPAGGDHHAAQAPLGGGVHLGHRVVDAGGHGHHGHADAAVGVGGAEVGEPAVVGAGAGLDRGGVGVGPRAEARAERRAGEAARAEHVGVGEQHLGGHALLVEDGVAHRGVEAGAHLVVAGLLVPLLDELGVDHAAGQELLLVPVEGLAERGVEVLAVGLRRVGRHGRRPRSRGTWASVCPPVANY